MVEGELQVDDSGTGEGVGGSVGYSSAGVRAASCRAGVAVACAEAVGYLDIVVRVREYMCIIDDCIVGSHLGFGTGID